VRQPRAPPMPDGYARARGAEIVNLPNIITFARLCAVPVAIWLTLRNQLALTFGLFAAAGVSDAIDGWLARRRGGTTLGAMLDPLADKALLISMFITLALMDVLPDWLAILAVFRDLVIIGGLLIMWQLAMPVRIQPLGISKLNTALQILLIGTALFLRGFGLGAELLLDALVWLTAASTLLSGAAYVWKAAR
jgi:cardiolipin synthase (CMP-forming)